jgi:hypothetical protein
VTGFAKVLFLLREKPLLDVVFFVHSPVLLEKVENIKSTTSHAKRAQKMHNFPDDLITKISTNHKKKHKTHNV